MKAYVLVRCCTEGNYAPQVFLNADDAENALEEIVDNLLIDNGWDDDYPYAHPEFTSEPKLSYNGNPVYSYVYDFTVTCTLASITYVDDTWDELAIYEVEIPEKKEEK